jgi:hypothetical protein
MGWNVSSSLDFVPGAESGAKDIEKAGLISHDQAQKAREGEAKYDYFTPKNDPDADAQAAKDAASQQAIADQLKSFGTNELGQANVLYEKGRDARKGPVTAGQAASLANQKTSDTDAVQAEKNQLAHFLATSGMGASGLAGDLSGRIDLNKSTMENNRIIMEDNMKRQNAADFFNEAQTHSANALKALGMASQDYQAMEAKHSADRAERQQAYTGLLTTVATLVGTYYGGPAGGAAAGALVNSAAGGNKQADSVRQDTSLNTGTGYYKQPATGTRPSTDMGVSGGYNIQY